MEAMPVGAIVGSIAGGLIQGRSASRAADAQTAAANRQLDVQQQMFEQSRQDLSPYRDAGLPAINMLKYYLGLTNERPMTGATPLQITEIPGGAGGGAVNGMGGLAGFGSPGTGPRFQVGGQTFNTREEAEAYAQANASGGTPMPGFQQSPGYQFAVREGLGGIESSAAARGGLFSGATMQALQQRGNDLANQEFNNYLSRLEGRVSSGQNAAAQTANVNTNNAQMQTQSLSNIGNSKAAGAIAGGNALSGAINNGIGLWNYQNMLSRFPGAQ